MKVVRSFFSMTNAAITMMFPTIVMMTMMKRPTQTRIRASGIGGLPALSIVVSFPCVSMAEVRLSA